MIYFDNAATTKMSKQALDTYVAVAKDFYANSESLHRAGNESGQLILKVKNLIANKLNILTDGIIFTSGGTQSNQLGIEALASGSSQKEILVSRLEHSSVYQILDKLKEQGYNVKYLKNNYHGLITPEILRKSITKDTGLIIIQSINPITGIVQDIDALSEVAKENKIPIFVDMVQAMTKMKFDFKKISGFSASAHKFNGPKGSGILYLSPSVISKPLFKNVFQQNGYLPGTLDTPAIVSSFEAFQLSNSKMDETYLHLSNLKENLLKNIKETIKPVAPWAKYPGICGLLLPKTQGQEAATEMGQKGVSFSTVSACSIRDPRPDSTLEALNLTVEEQERYIRLSFGRENTIEEVKKVADMLNEFYG